MTTARKIIRRAMQKAGILTKTEVPSSDEAQDGLESLNQILSINSNDNLMIYTRQEKIFPLVGGKASYTIGIGGDFNTVRPMKIASAYVRIGNIDYTLYPYRDTSYDENTALKSLMALPSQRYVYDNGYPLGTITLYPVPTSNWNIHLRTEDELGQFTLDQDVDLPPGWVHFLTYELATILQPEYGQPINQDLKLIANQARATLEMAVAKNRTMDAQPIGSEQFNIYTGQGY